MKYQKVPQSDLKAVVKLKFKRKFFFLISLSHGTKKLDIFFQYCFFALSHCDKQVFCLLHWVTVTKKICICFKTDAKKVQTCCIFFYIFCSFWHFLCLFWQFSCRFWYFLPNFKNILAFFVQNIPILVVAVTQCHKQKIHLSQWLSVTNKTNLFRSDSVQQTILEKYPTSSWHVTKEKKPKQISFKIWISPPLSNYFGTFQLLCCKSFKDYTHSVLKKQDKLCPPGPWAELLYFCV